jgi:hypothetical protein
MQSGASIIIFSLHFFLLSFFFFLLQIVLALSLVSYLLCSEEDGEQHLAVADVSDVSVQQSVRRCDLERIRDAGR